MLLKYIGHRDMFPIAIGAKKYVFSPLNGYTIDVPDRDAQWMMQIAAHEFKVMPEIQVVEKPVEETVEIESLGEITPEAIIAPKRRGRPKKNAA